MKDLPLYAGIKEYSQNSKALFHMPGHKQNSKLLGRYMEDLLSLDVTEVMGTDNLHAPEGIILKAQERATKLFHGEETKFLVNGSTCGMEAMVLTVCNPGDEILVARNCHRSVYSGLILAGAKPIYLYPPIREDLRTCGGITKESVKKALVQHPNVKGLLLTHPTYEGFCSDIESIAKLLHENHKILLVDEAHGAHLGFHRSFPKSSMQQGADMVVQSSHKTLPALTQSAMLHVQGSRIDRVRLQQMLGIVQSSSPSYILLSALDVCCKILEENGAFLFEKLLENLEDFERNMESLEAFRLVQVKEGSFGIVEKDPAKLVIDVQATGYTGQQVDEMLRQKYGVQMEMSTEQYVLGIATLCDEKKTFDLLFEALRDIERGIERKQAAPNHKHRAGSAAKVIYSPREAMFAPKEILSLEESIGKIAGEFIIPYPPGIPILAPGEEITKEILEEIVHLQKTKSTVLGSSIAQGKLQVIKE